MESLPSRVPAVPRATNLDEAAILALADEVAQRCDYGPGADLDACVRKLGGSVRVVARSDGGMGHRHRQATLVVTNTRNFVIRVPDDVGYTEKRYSIAHELGHYFLHYPAHAGYSMEAHHQDDNRAEWEANVFATGFLVPTSALRVAHASTPFVTDLAWKFGVMPAAIRSRLDALAGA